MNEKKKLERKAIKEIKKIDESIKKIIDEPKNDIQHDKGTKNDIKCISSCDRLAVRDEPKETAFLQYFLSKNEIVYCEEVGDKDFYKLQNQNCYVMKKYLKVV